MNAEITAEIIKVLSSHRQSHNSALPQPLRRQDIVKLVQGACSPSQDHTEEIKRSLDELEARGEVLRGPRNLYCVAPPTLIARTEKQLNPLQFCGDRSYLGLAHKLLKSGQPSDSLEVAPSSQEAAKGFFHIHHRLKEKGIRLRTVEEMLQVLPNPSLPKRNSEVDNKYPNPFREKNWPDQETVTRYSPQLGEQKDRWREPMEQSLHDGGELLRLPTGEYLWYKQGSCYELTPDQATLAMFKLDQDMKSPVKVVWDKDKGELNLDQVTLPGSYARFLWRLSEPTDAYRVRRFGRGDYDRLEQAMKKLGCKLV